MRWPQPLRTLAGTLPGGTWTFQSWMWAIAVAAGYPEQSADLLAAGARQQPGSFDADPGADERGPDTLRAEPRKTGSLRSSGHPKACPMSLRTRLVLSTAVLNEDPVSAICRGSSWAAILTGPRLQVTGEPVPGQPGDLLKRPWFLDQGGGTWIDLQPRLPAQLLHRLAVELDDHRVESPDDEQGRLGYRAQVLAGEVGAAAAGDDRRHRAGPLGGRDQRRRGAGAGAEEPDRQARGGPVGGQPVGQGGDPEREHADVEPELAGPRVELLLRRGEQVGQNGGQARALQFAGHVAVARAVAAAAPARREHDPAARRLRDHQVGVQRHAARRDLKAPLDKVHGFLAAMANPNRLGPARFTPRTDRSPGPRPPPIARSAPAARPPGSPRRGSPPRTRRPSGPGSNGSSPQSAAPR